MPRKKDPPISRCLNIRQAAKYAGVAHPSIRAAIKTGRLTAYKTAAGHTMLDKKELDTIHFRKPNYPA